MLKTLAPLAAAALLKSAAFITAGLATTTIAADTEFTDNIPADLARALLSGAGTATEVRIYSDIPDNFPAFALPDGVTVLGSVDQGHNRQVILISEGDGQQQYQALVDSLEQGGFLLLRPMAPAVPQTGFVSANPQAPSVPAQLCHDTQGLVYLRRHSDADRTFINMTSLSENRRGGYSCAAMAAQTSNRASPAFFNASTGAGSLHNSIPRLVLPDEASTQSSYRPAFISGSSDQAESKIDFSIAWTLPEVYDFFAGQLADQNWIADGQTTGNRVALSAWTREENNQLLLGTLRLVSGDDEGYEAVFSVSVLD
ncbi:MAG: hypothetical protein CMQ34_08535 [Gammaproteobacteria bacterium]|nr:hypothetical protein [Gammaproteobacteria bacterium]